MQVTNWMAAAAGDLKAAEVLHQAALYPNCIFHCQQAIEKALKAICLQKSGKYPPRHELDALAKYAGIWKQLTPKAVDLLAEIEAAYIASRYPEDDTYHALNNKRVAKDMLYRTRRLFGWLSRNVG